MGKDDERSSSKRRRRTQHELEDDDDDGEEEEEEGEDEDDEEQGEEEAVDEEEGNQDRHDHDDVNNNINKINNTDTDADAEAAPVVAAAAAGNCEAEAAGGGVSSSKQTKPQQEEEEEEEEQDNGGAKGEDLESAKRRSQRQRRQRQKQQKLKLVLKLPRSYPNANGGGSGGGGGGATGSRRRGRPRKTDVLQQQQQQQQQRRPPAAAFASEECDEDEDGEKPLKKRRLNAVAASNGTRVPALRPCGSSADKDDKPSQISQVAGTASDSTCKTPMPDIRLLEFILDKLQKKDTYGVFAFPVDPKELPDYHEIIQHPMDFSTIRKKLAKESYTYFEQFEKDVFLICSNAMHYNASDTIYYKQARSIQELARKKFQALQTDPESIEAEFRLAVKTKPSSSNRKSSKKSGGRALVEPAGSDFSGANIATGGDAFINERTGNGSANSDMVDMKAEKSEDFSASIPKNSSLKNVKRPQSIDENRRATYKQFVQPENGTDSIFSVFDGVSKQLIPVGIRAEYAYARSLACFAANMGPVVWKIASQRIQRALPPGVSFGPGWVGEQNAPNHRTFHEGKSVAPSEISGTSAAVRESTFKSNSATENIIARNENIAKNISIEGRPDGSASTSASLELLMPSNSKSLPPHSRSISNFRVDNKVTNDLKAASSNDEGKGSPRKPNMPISSCNELSHMGSKFASEVTQSRLLEMVSRNNSIMHASKQDNSKPVANLQPSASGNGVCDSEDNDTYRKRRDEPRTVCSSPGKDVSSSMATMALNNRSLGSGASNQPHVSNRQGNVPQELNSLTNSMAAKMQAFNQRASNLASNHMGFVPTVPLTGPPIRRDNAPTQVWLQHPNAHTLDAARARTRATSQPHMSEIKDSQMRDFSRAIPATEVPSNSAHQMITQHSGFHFQTAPKNNNKATTSASVSEPQQNRNMMMHPPHLLKSYDAVWRSIPSQFIPEQGLSTSKQPDLNVEFQKSKSPQQSSAQLSDSQQPDLALQL